MPEKENKDEPEARPQSRKRRASFDVGNKRQSSIAVRFGLALRHRRTQMGLTQVELSDATGVSRTHISEIENGHENITLELADRLAQALECDLSDLLARPQQPE